MKKRANERNLKTIIVELIQYIGSIHAEQPESVCDREERDMKMQNVALDVSFIADQIFHEPNAINKAKELITTLKEYNESEMAKDLEISLGYLSHYTQASNEDNLKKTA